MNTTRQMQPTRMARLSRRTKLLTSVAAGGCAVFLMGCRDRDPDIVRTDTSTTAEQRENVAYNTPATPAPASTAATPATSGSSSDFAQSSSTAPAAPAGAQVAESDTTQITLHEEQLNVDKKEVDAGGVLVSKEVVTEQVEQPVELERERVQVTELSAEEARDIESGEARIDEQQIYIPLTREQAVAQKDVTTSGAVQIEKETDMEETTVAENVRREVVDVERQGEADMEQSTDVNATSGYASATPAGNQQDLEQRIRESLRSEESLALSQSQIEDIEIRVDQDTVTLSGNVPDQQMAQRIEERVREIEGVQMVQNELEADTGAQAAE